jgi:hypothetical protein
VNRPQSRKSRPRLVNAGRGCDRCAARTGDWLPPLLSLPNLYEVPRTQSLEGARVENRVNCCAAASDDRTSVFWLMSKQRGLPPSRTSVRRTHQSPGRSSESGSLDVSQDQSVARPSSCPYAVRCTRPAVRSPQARPADGEDPQWLPAQADARRERELSGSAGADPLTVLVELRTMSEAVERVDPAAIAFVHCWYDGFGSLWVCPAALDESYRV